MKALEFLKEQKRRHINMANSMKVVYFDDELDESIKELEELENRNCSNCKYGMQYVNSEDFWCDNSVDVGMGTVYADFYCNRWESK